MLRTALTGIAVAVMTIILAPIAVAAHVLRVEGRTHEVQQWCMHTWGRTICRAAGVRLVLHGAEYISPDRGTIYASNHVSWFDIFAIASVLPRYTFVAKAELRRIPIFGWGAEGAEVVFLERENRKSAFEVYRFAAQKVAEGLSVVVCPESTRGRTYALRPFKKGPFVLAIAAKAPIVPVVVFGAREIMAKGSFLVRPGTVHVHLHAPVETAGYDYDHRQELMRAVWHRMADTLRDVYGIGSDDPAMGTASVEKTA